MTETSDLVEVSLLAMSLDDYREASAHHDELFREFALILGSTPEVGHEVPGRLLALIEELTERFGGFTTEARATIDEALERGDDAIDLVYHVPPETKEAVIRFGELLAQADQYCSQGALLTIGPPPDAVAFRDWYLSEFATQIDGGPPTPWPEYRARSFTQG